MYLCVRAKYHASKLLMLPGPLIKYDKKLDIMRQFRADIRHFRAHHAGNYAIFSVHFKLLYNGLRRKKVFCTHLWRYSVHGLRTNLIFKQIPLHIPHMGFILHVCHDALP